MNDLPPIPECAIVSTTIRQTPAPAHDAREVARCSDCPFSILGDTHWCLRADRSILDRPPEVPPWFCPLRTAPVLVTLKVSETHERIVVATSLVDVAKAFPDARRIRALGAGVSMVKP